MNKLPLDIYDDMPRAMRAYIANYGFHFSKAACDFAVSCMKVKDRSSNTQKRLEPWDKDTVDKFLLRHEITLSEYNLYDRVYVANMARADYYGSSLPDEQHLALFIRDYINDIDASPEKPFRHWLSDRVGSGEPVEWEDIL